MYNKRLIFWSACLGLLIFGIAFITLGSIATDLTEKLKLTEIESGTLFSILPIGILMGSLLFGPVVDRYGYKILLVLSCLLMFAGFEGLAYTQSLRILRVFILFIGIGGGAVNGATNALVSDISDKDKGANLSLLGVFFGLGSLGMPLLLGILRNTLRFEIILATVGALTLVVSSLFFLLSFPPPKQAQSFPLTRTLSLLKDNALLFIAFFLFFQSSFEGIMNNWTTSYLINQTSVQQSNALFGLSFFVAGMVVMRLFLGKFLRSIPTLKIMMISFILIILGLTLLKINISFSLAIAGLFVLGSGLAGGFPIMLGMVGARYSDLSGTVFSFVMVVALLGNTIINYVMGIIANDFGIKHLIDVAIAELAIMVALFFFINRKNK